VHVTQTEEAPRLCEELRETQRVGALIHSHDTGRWARPYGACHQRPMEVAVHPGRPPEHRPVDHFGLIYICFLYYINYKFHLLQ
jgi:hypothetical protein